MKIYLAGKINGQKRELAEEKFRKAEKLLAEQGYKVINPMKVIPEGVSNKVAMRVLIPIMLDCDGIYLLDDWQFSAGAKIEEMLARYCGLKILNQDEYETT